MNQPRKLENAMSGGQLIVIDRLGRDVKKYPLPEGMVTLGSDRQCDICVLRVSSKSSTVRPHHATVSVHANQTILRNVGGGETLVNGVPVSVVALQHEDVIKLGDSSLRWEYTDSIKRQQKKIEPALSSEGGVHPKRTLRRRSLPEGERTVSGGGGSKDRAVQLAIELSHRASMPDSTGGKQVAVVQPQRRDNNERAGTTKASMWIESRKSSPRKNSKQSPMRSASASQAYPATKTGQRVVSAIASAERPRRSKSTPLRMAVLRKAQNVQKTKVTKIEEPIKIDETKQAAIMLMTGHAGRSKISPASLLRRSVLARRSAHCQAGNKKPRKTVRRTTLPLEKSISATDNVTPRRSYDRPRFSGQKSVKKSPAFVNPKKSALKDPKKINRKTESIKFDLSNLNNSPENKEPNENISHSLSSDNTSSEDLTLHFPETPSSPSARKPINSRGSKILEKSIGTPMTVSPTKKLDLESTNVRKSSRGYLIVQRALNVSHVESTISESKGSISPIASSQSDVKSHSVSPRSNRNMESYSIVDLISIDSTESQSVYDSVTSNDNTLFATPQTRMTRSTIGATLLGSSTPRATETISSLDYSQNTSDKSHSNLEVSSVQTITDSTSRLSKSLLTPENTMNKMSIKNDRISRPSRSRSRLNDSDLILIDENETNASPKTSKRATYTNKSNAQNDTIDYTNTTNGNFLNEGTVTPENEQTTEDAGTPVLRIQTLLNSSQETILSWSSRNSRSKRITGATIESESRRSGVNSSIRKTKLNLTNESDSLENSHEDEPQSVEETVTPKSSVKLVHETVKNKHSTAKRPQSKRSIIDDLNESDIVKQLFFNSPVKRKLSQSMTEFSRRLEQDDEVRLAKRATRSDSILDRTEAITPELFVSPMQTPRHSPDMAAIHRLLSKSTTKSDSKTNTNTKSSSVSIKTRKSGKNDLNKVSRLKLLFVKSPENRLSDVRVKDIFVTSPKNDLRRVSGVRSLFGKVKESEESRNDLTDVRGVKRLYRNSPRNDLRNVSGIKRALRNNSPKNDLSDVRGVRDIFKQRKKTHEANFNLSGVEKLYNESQHDTEDLFDRIAGKPKIKAIYSKTYCSRSDKRPKKTGVKSLHTSIDVTPNNVENWLQSALRKCTNKAQFSKNRVTRELCKLSTYTVEGRTPLRPSRVRVSTVNKCSEGEERRSTLKEYSARKLPIKKRSIRDTSSENTLLRPYRLPIKKRRVAHSTPVKNNNFTITMNASDISRVSPIRLEHTDTPQRDGKGLTSHINQDMNQESEKVPNIQESKTLKAKLKISPKRTRSRKTIDKQIPVQKVGRTRRGNNNNNLDSVKKRRTSLVISKKAPVTSPKVVSKKKSIKLIEDINADSKRTTRRQRQIEVEENKTSKKITQTKKQKPNITVSNPSPVQQINGLESSENLQKDIKVKRTRKTVTAKSLKVTQELKRKTRAATEMNSKSENQVKKVEKSDENLPGKRNRKMIVQGDTIKGKDKLVQKINPRTVQKSSRQKKNKNNLSADEQQLFQEMKPARRNVTQKNMENSAPINIPQKSSQGIKRNGKQKNKDNSSADDDRKMPEKIKQETGRKNRQNNISNNSSANDIPQGIVEFKPKQTRRRKQLNVQEENPVNNIILQNEETVVQRKNNGQSLTRRQTRKTKIQNVDEIVPNTENILDDKRDLMKRTRKKVVVLEEIETMSLNNNNKLKKSGEEQRSGNVRTTTTKTLHSRLMVEEVTSEWSTESEPPIQKKKSVRFEEIGGDVKQKRNISPVIDKGNQKMSKRGGVKRGLAATLQTSPPRTRHGTRRRNNDTQVMEMKRKRTRRA